MPITPSGWKRMRTSAKAREKNVAVRQRIRKVERAAREAAAGTDTKKSTEALRAYFSIMDKSVKQGVIKRQTADRKKSRLSRLFRKK